MANLSMVFELVLFGTTMLVCFLAAYLFGRSKLQIKKALERETDLRSAVVALQGRDRLADEYAASLALQNQELIHRYKNFLSIVQAIADRTLSQAPDLASARLALSARIFALGATTALLASREHHSAPLDAVVRAIVAPHDPCGARFACSGPTVLLPPRMVLGMGLMLHELITNAVKYGALSQNGGRIELRWSIQAIACACASTDGPETLHLSWRESNGPVVVPPVRSGFGTVLLQKAAAAYFRGRGDLAFQPEGLVFLLEAPMPTLTEESDRR